MKQRALITIPTVCLVTGLSILGGTTIYNSTHTAPKTEYTNEVIYGKEPEVVVPESVELNSEMTEDCCEEQMSCCEEQTEETKDCCKEEKATTATCPVTLVVTEEQEKEINEKHNTTNEEQKDSSDNTSSSTTVTENKTKTEDPAFTGDKNCLGYYMTTEYQTQLMEDPNYAEKTFELMTEVGMANGGSLPSAE